MTGDQGPDRLTGGNGGDTFVYAAGESLVASMDTITDFVTRIDKINL